MDGAINIMIYFAFAGIFAGGFIDDYRENCVIMEDERLEKIIMYSAIFPATYMIQWTSDYPIIDELTEKCE